MGLTLPKPMASAVWNVGWIFRSWREINPNSCGAFEASSDGSCHRRNKSIVHLLKFTLQVRGTAQVPQLFGLCFLKFFQFFRIYPIVHGWARRSTWFGLFVSNQTVFSRRFLAPFT
jgi:hypothetical protein